jgi:hypothetical protein
LDRGLEGEPSETILALLKIPFKDPNDPDLARRRQQLSKQFTSIDPSRASNLYDRLKSEHPADEMSRLFWKLSTRTRNQMLAILEKKILDYRYISRAIRDLRNDPRYIDNLVEQVQVQGNEIVIWFTEGGKPTPIIIPRTDIQTEPVRSGVVYNKDTLYPDRQSAFNEFVIPLFAKSASGYPNSPLVIAFYKGEHNTIVPTALSEKSTPRIIATLHAIAENERQQELAFKGDAQAMADMFHSFYDTFNFLPLTVDEEGNVSFNPDTAIKDVLTGILLHRTVKGIQGHSTTTRTPQPEIPQATARRRKVLSVNDPEGVPSRTRVNQILSETQLDEIVRKTPDIRELRKLAAKLDNATAGSLFERWVNRYVFRNRSGLRRTRLTVRVKDNPNLGLGRDRSSDVYIEADGSVWDAKIYRSRKEIDVYQLDDYRKMEEAGFVLTPQGKRQRVQEINYVFSDQAAAEVNRSLVQVQGGAEVWFINDEGMLMHLD